MFDTIETSAKALAGPACAWMPNFGEIPPVCAIFTGQFRREKRSRNASIRVDRMAAACPATYGKPPLQE
jgi:hypothetical protein